MSGVRSPAPQALLDQYRRLTTEQKTEFIQLVANESNADLAGAFWNAFPMQERNTFLSPLLTNVARILRPILIREAIKIVKAHAELSEGEMLREISAAYSDSISEVEEGIALREEYHLKAKRDRKSKPETIRRYVEICDLRHSNEEYWSHEQLAKKYRVKRQTIQKILNEEYKWRRLFAALPAQN